MKIKMDCWVVVFVKKIKMDCWVVLLFVGGVC